MLLQAWTLQERGWAFVVAMQAGEQRESCRQASSLASGPRRALAQAELLSLGCKVLGRLGSRLGACYRPAEQA